MSPVKGLTRHLRLHRSKTHVSSRTLNEKFYREYMSFFEHAEEKPALEPL